MKYIDCLQALDRHNRQPSSEIVFFSIASGGLGEDISKRKPIRIVGKPRHTFYTLKELKDGMFYAYDKMCTIAYPAFEKYGPADTWPQAKRRAYQRWLNRRRVLRHAIDLKSL